MKSFRTTFTIPSSNTKLSHQTPVVFIGSCFAENIGGKLEELKFPVDINPFGILYNPISVMNSLEILISGKVFSKEDLYFYNTQWVSFCHQTEFSDSDPKVCLDTINQRIRYSSRFLQEARFLFITFGTAWVYEWKVSGQVVSNCHKIPASKFERKLLTPDDITRVFLPLLKKITKRYPSLGIIFSVSPVRHWKDGAEGNQISKATLLLAIHRIRKDFPHAGYFPAYELVMDDLRDYRFYAGDMIHLDEVGIEYIWDRFREVYLEEDTAKLIPEITRILSACHHRPLKSGSEAHKTFMKKYYQATAELMKKYPFLNLERELEHFRDQPV